MWSVLQSRLSFFDPYTPLACAVDFLLNAVGILYATTVLSSAPTILIALLLGPAVLVLLTQQPKRVEAERQRKPPSKQQDAQHDAEPLPIKPFVTHYRGAMLVITCSSILAVDFAIFPRRFAKVENWGTSLMDLGVGLFVFSAGVVAARPILKQQLNHAPQRLSVRLRSAIRHALPLFVLGLIRLYSVKGLDYAEHVTEYGVHWNFFFTMGIIPPFVAVLDAVFYYFPSYQLLAIVVGVVYQVLLDSTTLTSFILTAPRVDLVSKNREGLFSSIGYLAIFLAGQGAGTYVLPRHAQTKNPFKSVLFQKLAMSSAVWCALYFICIDHRLAGVGVSRRLANLPYVLWVAAFNSCGLLLFYLVEALIFPDLYDTKISRAVAEKRRTMASSRLLRCFNRNGLALFLLANLLTGLVNLTLPTLRMGDLAAMGVLILYMAILSATALLLDSYNMSIKL